MYSKYWNDLPKTVHNTIDGFSAGVWFRKGGAKTSLVDQPASVSITPNSASILTRNVQVQCFDIPRR